jgi:UDP-N-acetylglucosamine 2-epimerase (non-hydrolysing)/UDP-GlcNAc3NAcA epimerase
MPEEINRVLTDHAATLLLCPAQAAAANLRAERVVAEVEVVGDVMVDIAQLIAPRARARLTVLAEHGLEPGGYVLATAHRAGNVDDPDRLRQLMEVLRTVDGPVVLPLHPRTRSRLEAAGLLDALRDAPSLRLLPPLGYLDFTTLLVHARTMLTDSGGVQKEAYLAGVPCVTMRATTEWTETVDAGWNVLVDLDAEAAQAALARAVPSERPELYGDGRAGERVVQALVERYGTGAVPGRWASFARGSPGFLLESSSRGGR